MSGPLPDFLLPITAPASRLYGLAVARRNARFDQGIGVQSIDRPVVSVGNITTGGTGKTPMVAWIAEQLLAAGHHPAIAMRGYKSKPGQTSDEQAEYTQRLPNVPVIANPDRTTALQAFLPSHPEIDCILLDDGFQHRQLKRDLDLVLIDATANTFMDRLLPAGNLREPLKSLRRADAVIVTHADPDDSSQISNLKSQIEAHHGSPPLAFSQHTWTHLEILATANNPQRHELNWLRGKHTLTMLGVGNPQSIITQLENADANVAVNIPCADHELFDRAKVAVARGLCTGCDAMVVTAKDWVKLRDLIDWSVWPVPIVVPQLAIDVFEGASALRNLLLTTVRNRAAANPTR